MISNDNRDGDFKSLSDEFPKDANSNDSILHEQENNSSRFSLTENDHNNFEVEESDTDSLGDIDVNSLEYHGSYFISNSTTNSTVTITKIATTSAIKAAAKFSTSDFLRTNNYSYSPTDVFIGVHESADTNSDSGSNDED